VATFVNERGDLAELTYMPAGVSACFLQKPTQTSLQGRVAYPGLYELKRSRVEHVRGVSVEAGVIMDRMLWRTS